MARVDLRHPGNVDGDWYVDTRCIDCDVARHYAPDLVVADEEGLSVVVRQPSSPADEMALWRAALACPTQSIGTMTRRRPPAGVFPWPLVDGVHLCGYNDESSFGAHSYLVVRPEGNLLVDAPRWTRRLADAIADRGGVVHVLLSHRDDVADAHRYADRFGARVWIHEADRSAAPFATDVLSGTETVALAPRVRAVPVPGHTRGSVVYEVDRRYLFTGDSLHWNRERERLDVFGSVTWFSWAELTASMARLADEVDFGWVLPGHGMWGNADPAEFDRQLRALASEMADHTDRSWDHRPLEVPTRGTAG